MFQVRSITVNIGPQEKSHPSKVNLKSDAQKAKACCWLDMVSVEKNGWSVGVVLSSWCTKLAPQNHPLFSWAILEVEERKPLPLTKRQVFNTNLKGMFLSGTGFDIREQKANNCLFRNQAWCSFFLPYHIKSGACRDEGSQWRGAQCTGWREGLQWSPWSMVSETSWCWGKLHERRKGLEKW